MNRFRIAACGAWLLAVGWLPQGSTIGADIKDAEAATHGDEAASYQVVDTYEFPGFKIIQFDLAVLSHYSYMLISGGECLVVDPGRDIFTYLETAKKEGVKITRRLADALPRRLCGRPYRVRQAARRSHYASARKPGRATSTSP